MKFHQKHKKSYEKKKINLIFLTRCINKPIYHLPGKTFQSFQQENLRKNERILVFNNKTLTNKSIIYQTNFKPFQFESPRSTK